MRPSLSGRLRGIPGERIDGNDVLAVNDAATRAIERARRGEGPTLLELMTYRIAGHSRSDACEYRPDEEEAYWFARDPIKLFRNLLVETKTATEAELDAIDASIEERRQGSRASRILPDPLPEDAMKDVYWNSAREKQGAKEIDEEQRAAPAGN